MFSAAEVVESEADPSWRGLRSWLCVPPTLCATEAMRPAEGDFGMGGAENEGASGDVESGMAELWRGEGTVDGSASELPGWKAWGNSDSDRRAGCWVGEGRTWVGDCDARRASAGGSCVFKDACCSAPDSASHTLMPRSAR